MKHIKTFVQMNESAIGDKMKSALEKLSGKENKSLIELLIPYRHLLKPDWTWEVTEEY